MKITDKLFKNQDNVYRLFQAKLMPTIDINSIIGVRVPIVRDIAKEYINDKESKVFMNDLPHKYFDENMLHGLLISEIKDYDECIKEVNKFLPYIDNWAVCDTMSPKIFKKNQDKLINEIIKWSKKKDTYTIRFGIEMLMTHYLDDNYKKEYLEIPFKVKSDEYYVQMMIAWFYATALAKRWDDTIKYVESKQLDKWVHNKIIQKSIESYRITEEQKEYLKTLKML